MTLTQKENSLLCDLKSQEQLCIEKYGKTPTQVALRYLTQKGVVPIPKSTHANRIKENFDIFDFSLTIEDEAEIDKSEQIRCGSHPLHLTRS